MASIYQQCDSKKPHGRHKEWDADENAHVHCDGITFPDNWVRPSDEAVAEIVSAFEQWSAPAANDLERRARRALTMALNADRRADTPPAK